MIDGMGLTCSAVSFEVAVISDTESRPVLLSVKGVAASGADLRIRFADCIIQ